MKPIVLIAAAVSLCSGAALAADAEQLLKEKACLSCHTLDKKLVGPAYKEVAAKYKSRKDAEAGRRRCRRFLLPWASPVHLGEPQPRQIDSPVGGPHNQAIYSAAF